jgi:hypothetical protein
MIVWKILYSPYDAGALVITIIAVTWHALRGRARARR